MRILGLWPAGGPGQAQAAPVIRFRPPGVANQRPTDSLHFRRDPGVRFWPASGRPPGLPDRRRLGLEGGEHVIAEKQVGEQGRDDRLGSNDARSRGGKRSR